MTNTATKVKSHDFDIQVVYRITPEQKAVVQVAYPSQKMICANKMNFSDTNKIRIKLHPSKASLFPIFGTKRELKLSSRI